jgi:hypothetical protein
MTQKEAQAALNVVASTLFLNSQQVYTLIDPGATYSFIVKRFESKLKVKPIKLDKWFIINTPLRDVVCVHYMYKGVMVKIKGLDVDVNLTPLEFHDFDLILGMDWLSEHKAQIDSFAKTVTIQGIDDKRKIFNGEISCQIV